MNELNNPVQKEEEREIDILRLLQIMWKRAWLIVLVTVIFAVGAFVYSAFFITPTYRSDFTAYVDNRVTTTETGGMTTTSDLSASIYLTYMYEKILTSRSVLNDAAAQCGLDLSYNSLKNMVSTSVTEDTALITVTVVAADPQQSKDLAAAIADVAPAHVARMKEGSSMRILDEPVLPSAPYAPDDAKNAVLGAAIGFVLITALVLVIDLVNDIVRGAEELEGRYDVVVIGNIPDLATANKSKDNYAYAYGKAGKK